MAFATNLRQFVCVNGNKLFVADVTVYSHTGGDSQISEEGVLCVPKNIQCFGTAWGARDEILTFAYSEVSFWTSLVSYKQKYKIWYR